MTGEKPFDRVMVIAVCGDAADRLVAAIQARDVRYLAVSIEAGDMQVVSTAPWPRSSSDEVAS